MSAEDILVTAAFIKDIPYFLVSEGKEQKRVFLTHPNIKSQTSLFPTKSGCHDLFLFENLLNLPSDTEVYLDGESVGTIPILTIWYDYLNHYDRFYFGGLNSSLQKKLAKGIAYPKGMGMGMSVDLLGFLLLEVSTVKKVYDYVQAHPIDHETYGHQLPYHEFLPANFPREKWDKYKADQSENVHWGQLKLHLSEMEYLLAKGATEKRTLVIYPGGGPGLHVPLLAALFPLVKFVLIDPVFSKPEISPHQQIFWIADLFDVKYFQTLVNKVKASDPDLQILMFSDIRSTPGPEPKNILKTDSEDVRRRKVMERKKYDEAFENEAQMNMKMQLGWQMSLQIPSLFKFRLRFSPGKTKYPKGPLAYQVFAREVSSELRLWSDDPSDLVEYDNTKIEQEMFYFNIYHRSSSFYDIEPVLGFNYDSTKTGQIFRKYIQETGMIKSVAKSKLPTYGPEKTNKQIENTLVVMLASFHDGFFHRDFLIPFIEGRVPSAVGKKKLGPPSGGDDYPYKRLFTSEKEIRDRFERLKTYQIEWAEKTPAYEIVNLANTVEPFKLLFRGLPAIAKVYSSNYEEYDNLSDYFQEQVRVGCKRSDQTITPHQYWELHREKIKRETSDPSAQREILYKEYYECTTFKPSLLVGLAKFFETFRVLDISSGWGDRLIGAIASSECYSGTDPNKALQPGYHEIIKFFGVTPIDFKVQPTTFEAVKIDRKKEFDLVLTSPPYFNLEEYSGVKIGGSVNEWVENFLRVSLEKASDALVTEGYMVININDPPKGVHYVKDMLSFNLPDMVYLGCISQALFDPRSGHRPPAGREDITKVPKSPQPFWVWKKVELPSLEDLNPKVVVTKHKYEGVSFRVVRDDFLLGGTKQRVMKDFFGNHPEGVIYPGPPTGYAQIALALGAKLSGGRVKILIPKVRPPTLQTILASQLGAEVIEFEGERGSLKNLKEVASKIAKTEGMYFPKLGFEGEEFKELMETALEASLDLDRNKKHNFWLVGGSGTLALVLYDLFPKSTFNVVQVGKEIDWYFEDKPRAKLFVAKEKFAEDTKDLPPYPSLASYDAKVWQFAKKDLVGAIIWNVAGPVEIY